MSHSTHRFQLLMIAAVACILLPGSPRVSSAQMGGMGGGGMGGGMGRGGAPGGMGGRGASPSAIAKERLEQADQLTLMLDNHKPLQLSKTQQDSVKRLRKEMRDMQEPLFKQLEKIVTDSMGARGGRGDMGGARGGGMGGGMGRGNGGLPPGGGDDAGGGRGRGGLAALLPDTAKRVLARLEDIQDAYRDRARAQLDSTQRVRVDSIQNAVLEKEREKARKEREKMIEERRGRG